MPSAVPRRESHLNQDAFLTVLRGSHAHGVHSGYGFLSENAEFATKVEAAGVRVIGPSPRWIDAIGHETHARDLAAQHGTPVGNGSNVLSNKQGEILAAARSIGYPVLVKPAAGGSGIGMIAAKNSEELLVAVERARSMAMRGLSNNEVYLEKFLKRPRHIEFQVLGDRYGTVKHLFDRDCSV